MVKFYSDIHKKSHHASLKIFIFILLLLVIIICSIYFFIFNKKQTANLHPTSIRIQTALKNSKTSSLFRDLIPQKTTLSDITENIKPAPKFEIKNYSSQVKIGQPKKEYYVYTFKTNYDPDYIYQFAYRLLGNDIVKIDNNDSEIIEYANEFGSLIFHQPTGSYILDALVPKIPYKFNNEINISKFTSYLQNELGIIDDTITATSTYKLIDDPDSTYIVLHRKWEDNNPILNPAGLVNIPENVKIKNLALDQFFAGDLKSNEIYYTTNMPIGNRPKDDFNTMTISISSAGNLHITSNIRQIIRKEPLSKKNLTLLDPSMITKELIADGAYFNIGIPSGEGNIDLNTVFPDNKFITDNAIITDIALGYLEKPQEVLQTYMYPVYFIRGYGYSQNGIRTVFSQVVPAIDDSNLAKNNNYLTNLNNILNRLFNKPALAQEINPASYFCQDDSEICNYETFKNTPTPAPPTTIPQITINYSPTPVYSTQAPTPTPTKTSCALYDKDGNIIEYGQPFYVDGLGQMIYFSQNLSNGPLFIQSDNKTFFKSLLSRRGINAMSVNQNLYLNAMDRQIAVMAAKIIRDDPNKIVYTQPANSAACPTLYSFNRSETKCLNLNKIFTNINYDLLDTKIIITKPVNSLLMQAVNNLSGWTVDKLADKSDYIKFPNIPVKTLINTRRAGSVIAQELKDYTISDGCYILSGISPSIYFYPKKITNIAVDFSQINVTYLDPYLKEKLILTADNNSHLNINGLERNKIYYRYSDVIFDRPENGFTVKTNELNITINKLANQIGLNQQEKQDLYQEINESLTLKTKKPYIYIGLIDSQQLNNKLPLTFSPVPDKFYRIHFYLEYIDNPIKSKINPGQPIDRSEFIIIEIGAYAK